MRDDTHQTPHPSQSLDRRDLLKGLVGAATLSALPQAVHAEAVKEPPVLAELVSSGKLPPLAERVSANPLVVKVEKVGRYGGSLRRGLRGSSDHNGILRMVGNQGLVRWNLAFTEVLPNVAEKWEVNADSTEFTFHLRKDMKWSDG
jgi:peptide/nickel transport system substrate-binding protein